MTRLTENTIEEFTIKLLSHNGCESICVAITKNHE